MSLRFSFEVVFCEVVFGSLYIVESIGRSTET